MSSLPPPLPYTPRRAVDDSPANASPPFAACLDDTAGTPITLARMSPETPPDSTAPAGPVSFSTSTSTLDSPACPPLLPLMSISVVDLLEADPRPSFVVSLISPAVGTCGNNAPHLSPAFDINPTTSGVSAPYVVYGNPALTSSPSLRGVLTSRHADIWSTITADTTNGHRAALPAVHHLGVCWTRSFLRGGRFVVFSANPPVAVEAVRLEPAEPPPAPAAATAAAAAAAAAAARDANLSPLPLVMSIASMADCQDPQPHPPEPPSSAGFPYEPTPSPTYAIPMMASQRWTAALNSNGPGTMPAAMGAGRKEESDGNCSQHRDAGHHQHVRQLEAITDLVPVGLLALDPEKNVSFANRAWFRIMGVPPLPKGKILKWGELLQHIEDEDQSAVLYSFDQIVRVPSISFGFCVKRRGKDKRGDEEGTSDPSPGSTLVLATATGEKDASGRLVRVIVCLREIVEEHRSIAAAADLYAQQANNLRRMTEYATVGLYDMDTDGRLRDANRVFIEMCGLDIGEESNLSMEIVKPWLWCVIDEDRAIVNSCINWVASGGQYQTMEVRLSKPWTTEDGAGNRIEAPRWIDATMLPIKDAEGKVISITGCASDVSLRKWQLERERQVKEEAIESRRQQENFVDVTSHEIRNPLTVIMHCADAVLESLKRIREFATRDRVSVAGSAIVAAESESVERLEALADAIEFTEIIVGSALHQKSIVDDILTMSKLDSDLLTVTAVTADPIEIVRSTVWMFDVQARQQKISLKMILDSSFEDLGVDYFDLDPSRLKQILINLLTNALKFTCSGDVREVTVSVGASRIRPTDETCSVYFVPRTELRPAKTVSMNPNVSREASVFLTFEVKDTGEGLTKEGRDTLFQKFVQVNSTTHVKHGGSGLGLFISKRLAELQNGAIGVASQPGIGSTFTFYIEAFISPRGVVPEVLTPAEAAKKALSVGLDASREWNAADDLTAASEGAPITAGNAASRGAISSSSTEIATTAPKNNISKTSESEKPSGAAETGSDRALPFNNSQPRSTADKATAAPAGVGRLATVSATPPKVSGVLLVEDDKVSQRVTRRYFEKGGFSVQVAANGLEAMDLIQQSDRCVPGSFPISVVLMDMEMPVQGGLECTHNIRALEAAGTFSGGRIPVVMITGNARPVQIADARAAGCDDVIIKPFQMQQLYEHIQLVIRMLWERDRHVLQGGGGGEVPAVEAETDTGRAALQQRES